jgi:GNAT superfamily N-acetyltransferase
MPDGERALPRVSIVEGPVDDLDGYANVSIAFVVSSVVDVESSRFAGSASSLAERPQGEPYVKDYDDAKAGGKPARWAESFDVTNWRLFVASQGLERVGGAVVAWDTPGLDMLGGRTDVAVLWDLRVAPEARGRGIGRALFGAAETWARGRGCRELIVETQDVNVPACRFYASRGCEPRSVREGAYPGLPHETQIVWRKDLVRSVP